MEGWSKESEGGEVEEEIDIDTQSRAKVKKKKMNSVLVGQTLLFSNPSFEMSQIKTTILLFFLNKHCYQSGSDLKFLTLLQQSVKFTN